MTKEVTGGGALYRNDYKLRAKLRGFANENRFMRKFITPYVRNLYRFLDSFLPYPRDFILKKVPKNGKCCEIGVWSGDFSKRIYKLCAPQELSLVDPWFFFTEKDYFDQNKISKYTQKAQDARHARVLEIFGNEIKEGKVRVFRETSMDALSHFPNDYFDLVYIDGNHDYEYVLDDISKYFEKTKRGGILSGDDYRLEGVQNAVHAFLQSKGLTHLLKVKNDQFLIQKP